MKKAKIYIALSLIFSGIWVGLYYKYALGPQQDEGKFIQVKITESPLNKRHKPNSPTASRMGEKANSLKNEMRAMGIPVYADELLAVPQGEANGVEDLNRAFELLDTAIDSDLKDLFQNRDKLTDQQISELMKSGIVQEILENARKASEKDYIDFGIDYQEGPSTLLPHLGSIRNLIKLISLASDEELKNGSTELAVDSLNMGIKINSMANDNITLISGLVEVAAAKILERNIDSLRDSGADLSETYSLLENELNTSLDDQLKSIDGERLFLGEWVFNKLLDSGMKNEEFHAMFGESSTYYQNLSKNQIQEEYAEYLGHMFDVRVMMEEPYHINHKKFDETVNKTPNSPLAAMILPAFSKIYKKYNDHQVSLKKNLLALKADQFKQENGEYPASLYELNVPEDYLVDNITGEQFFLGVENGKAEIIGLELVE